MRQEVQTDALCLGVDGAVPCVENRRWTVGGVTYATLNVPGLVQQPLRHAPDPAEFAARNAGQHRVAAGDASLTRRRAARAAVMLIAQANPGWDAPIRRARRCATRGRWRRPTASPTASRTSWSRCATKSSAFRRPVAYVHGDSHYFRVDKPFLDALGRRLENFTRVETFGNNAANGNNDVQWLKVNVEPRTREVFSYQPQIVPGNREAVPAP